MEQKIEFESPFELIQALSSTSITSLSHFSQNSTMEKQRKKSLREVYSSILSCKDFSLKMVF